MSAILSFEADMRQGHSDSREFLLPGILLWEQFYAQKIMSSELGLLKNQQNILHTPAIAGVQFACEDPGRDKSFRAYEFWAGLLQD